MEQKNLESLKSAHDYYATAIEVLTTRVKWYFEDFEGAHQTIAFLRSCRDQIKTDIEKVEPPVFKEPAAPLVMDLTHVRPETQESATQ